MVDFVQLRNVIRKQLEQDREIRAVNASGATLEAAVTDAATLLGIPIKRLEYEIVERGSTGVLGSGKKDWKISAYVRKAKVQFEDENAVDFGESDSAPVIEDRDGEAFMQLRHDGAYLKVVPPVGRGRSVSESDALHLIRMRDVNEYDEEMVYKVVNNAPGEYIRIGDFEHRISNDSWVKIEIAADEMQAFLTASPPGQGGCDVTLEGYYDFLKNNRVVHGINEKYMEEFADRPIYNERVVVAEGSKPEDGRDSYVHYNVDVDQENRQFREGSNGKIDFKELNIIKNVVENQPLAKVIPPEPGITGGTVTGKSIPAKSGKEHPPPLGKNVHLGDDQATIISDINGQVMLINGKLNVEPVYTVEGDVNLKTGNIDFLGTVIVNGNVEDGFHVKAAGNIEIKGTVGSSELEAEGDIIVQQGIMGKNAGHVKSGGTIWARFVENANIFSGNMVIVTDGVINSYVDAHRCIVCHGKRAHIVGGRLRAAEEINAKVLGSPTSGTETIFQVGIEPENIIKLETLSQIRVRLSKEFDEAARNLQSLINIKQQQKMLPDDKEAELKDLMERRASLSTELQKIMENTAKLEDYINTVEIPGKVSASSKVYPGVKIVIRNIESNVHTEYKATTFVLEDKLVKVTKYQEPGADVKIVPDGYATD